MVPVSAVIIAKNEADRLPICLQSLQGWLQEIIVVIHDCMDTSRTVAESFQAQVVEHAWENFSKQKNFGISCAKSPWIMRIDADEEVSSKLRNSIEQFFASNEYKQHTACKVNRLNRYLNRWINDHDYQIFLFKNENFHWRGTVHEKLCFQGSVKILPGFLYHYTERNISETLLKNIHYVQLQAEELATKYSRIPIIFALLTHPWITFFRFYVLKNGWRYGIAGFYLASLKMFCCFFKYLFTLEIKDKIYEKNTGTLSSR